MSVTAIKISPASGDDHASVFMSPDASSESLGTVESGEVLKVVGESGGFYQVAMKPKTPNVCRGGSGSTGTCLANPYTFLYNNPQKHKSLGRINNGTHIDIIELDDDHPGMIKVKCLTTNGTKIGFMEARYIFRSCIEPSEE